VSVIGPDQLDGEQHAALIQRAFAPILAGSGVEGMLTPEFHRWKYTGPLAPARIAVVNDGERLLATNAMYAVDVVWDDRRIRGWVSSDTATDPDARGPGYFLACLRALEKSLGPDELFFGFPNRNSLRGFQNVGWREQQVMPAWVRVVPGWSVGDLEPLPSFGDEYDAFAAAFMRGRPPMIERTGAYMSWRYSRHPMVQYTVLACRRDGRLAGVVVLREAKSFGRHLALVMECLGLDRGIEARLLRGAAGWARERRVWPIFTFSTVLTPTLGLRAGFLPVPVRLLPKRQALLGRGTGPMSSELFARRWELQLGDWDSF
jgi:hypothetical protein